MYWFISVVSGFQSIKPKFEACKYWASRFPLSFLPQFSFSLRLLQLWSRYLHLTLLFALKTFSVCKTKNVSTRPAVSAICILVVRILFVFWLIGTANDSEFIPFINAEALHFKNSESLLQNFGQKFPNLVVASKISPISSLYLYLPYSSSWLKASLCSERTASLVFWLLTIFVVLSSDTNR